MAKGPRARKILLLNDILDLLELSELPYDIFKVTLHALLSSRQRWSCV